MKYLRIFVFRKHYVVTIYEDSTGRDNPKDFYSMCFLDNPTKREVYDACVMIGETFCKDPDSGNFFCEKCCTKFPGYVWDALVREGKMVMSGDSDKGFDWVSENFIKV